jgi:hypothetical protein
MPAIDADIGAASRDVVTATWSDPAIAARHPSARDGTVEAAPGYFDSLADAQAVANQRGALIGAERRRFAVVADAVLAFNPALGLPQARVIDAEQSLDATLLAARIEVDFEQERTSLEVFG